MPPFTCPTWDCLPGLDDLCFESFDYLCHIAVLRIWCITYGVSPKFPHPTNTEYFQPSQIFTTLILEKQVIDNF